ncbi:MAG: NDP-sugar synthase, partial [Methylophilaceae bacterium]
MKAMILAAGKGTRVRPLTYELPKPMIPILGKPVMAYLIEHLA